MKSFKKVCTHASAFTLAAIAMPLMLTAGHTNTLLVADLDGREQVDSMSNNRSMIGDPNGRGEAYVFGIDGDAFTLCYNLIVDKIKIGEGVMAHIHRGARGSNGPVVANLAGPGDGNSADCLTEGEMGKFPTGISVSEILDNPEDFYVNVHTSEYPSGAIRGQLRNQLDK
jgi:hypothetical protein